MNNRLNLSLILICLILINFKIILVNEETLILICFATFCFLSTSRLSGTVSDFFKNQSETIKSELILSSSKVAKSTEIKKSSLQATLMWPQVFCTLKKDFNNFNNFILNQFPSFYYSQLQKKLQKKLEFSVRLELHLNKVLILIITEKLQSFVKLQNFCETVLNITAFRTIKKIYFREHLQKIIK